MQKRFLGNTPHQVSGICFGSITVSPLGAALSPEESGRVIQTALEAGINFIDTAQYYRNYPHIKAGISRFNGDVVITGKSYDRTTAGLAAAVEEARRGLDRDVIDIFLLHEVREDWLLTEAAGLLPLLWQLKQQGRIASVGISTHRADIAWLAAQNPLVEVIHPLINKVGVGIQGGSLDDMIAACRLADHNGKGVYGMKALGGGSLSSRAQEMLSWAFSRDYLHSVALGMKSEAEVINNIAWLNGLPSPCQDAVDQLPRDLHFDENPCYDACGACVRACPQGALTLAEQGLVKWDKPRCLYCGYCIPACPNFNISMA